MVSQPQSRFMLMLNFGLVYLFWGSTYLAIDIAVEHIPPPLLCAIRFTVAGAIMLAYCLLRGEKLRYSARELLQFSIVGNLLLTGGNLTLSFAERSIASGLAALLVASIPLWFLVLDSWLLGDHHISTRGVVGLGLGFAGTVVLLWPQLIATREVARHQLYWSLALLGGALSWALGSVLSKKWQRGTPAFGATAWQVFFAGMGNSIFAAASRDFGHATWTPSGVAAIAYLVVCGSLIGYTAYIYILSHAPTAKVSTYAYVNPLVAVFLGWLVLGESIDRFILAGSAIVVASVILVTSASVRPKMEALTGAEAVAD
jgi:drug/metabolite transporter (DMT)-like permease